MSGLDEEKAEEDADHDEALSGHGEAGVGPLSLVADLRLRTGRRSLWRQQYYSVIRSYKNISTLFRFSFKKMILLIFTFN